MISGWKALSISYFSILKEDVPNLLVFSYPVGFFAFVHLRLMLDIVYIYLGSATEK